MCGIIGILGPEVRTHGTEPARRMLETLVHRGPDGMGVAAEGDGVLGLARLAIIDLPAASGPFRNETGEILCVCNGQIYNSDELRRELEAKGHRFQTGVDTEVVLHLWEEHGPKLVDRLNGMFAFAVWDSRRKTLMLGRDRAGEKPLFYWSDGTRLLFGSELRALLAHPRVTPRLDPVALLRYLSQGFIPAPLSPLQGVHKLPAGHVLLAHEDGGEIRAEVSRYWDLADWYAAPGTRDRRSADELVAELDERLVRAVRRRSRSDVPYGVFLSGGIDSSTVLAYLAEIHGPGVPAFSIGHADATFDESRFARETARAFGADFHELILEESDLEEGLRHVGTEMDEPLGDASTIPTFLLSRFARQRVKVVLSGEGADELFGGYPTYLGHRLADVLTKVPAGLRRAAVAGLRKATPVSMGNVAMDYLVQCFAGGLDRPRLERHQAWFGSVHPDRLRTLLSPGVAATVGEAELALPFEVGGAPRELADSLAELLYTDFTLYLQDDLLTKVDRASMLASLEARAPFLDHELAQLVAGMPSRWKVRRLTTKAILRRTVRRRLPPEVLSRRKRGFNIPFSRWVLHGLGETLRRRFSRERVEARGLLSHGAVTRLLDEHQQRVADHRKPLFALLALDLWCDRTFGVGAAVPYDEAGSESSVAVRAAAS